MKKKKKKKKIRKIFTGIYKAAVNAERARSGYGADPSTDWLEDAIPLNAALIKAEPKIMSIIESLFPAIFELIKHGDRIKKPNTANGGTRIKYTCKAILFNLYLAYLVGSPVRYARDGNRYTRARRYGRLFFKYERVVPIVAAFEDLGLIHHRCGRYDREKSLGRQARMWASEKLVAMFNKVTKGYPHQVFSEDPEEPVVLRNENKKEIDYIDTPATILIRKNLNQYNDFITESEVAVASNGDREISLYNLKSKVFLNLLKGDGTITDLKYNNEVLKSSTDVSSKTSSDNKYKDIVDVYNILYTNSNIYNRYINKYISITHRNFKLLPVDSFINSNEKAYVSCDGLFPSACDASNYLIKLNNKVGLDDFELPFIPIPHHEISRSSEYLKQLSCIINHNISNLDIGDKPTLDEALLRQLFTKKLSLREFDVERLNFVINSKKSYRIFNENSFDQGGRFYGALHQSLPKEFRKDIFIGGEPTVELDYAAHHIRILYHLLGIDYREDPYLALTDNPEERKIFKKLLLIVWNVETEKEAIEAFRGKYKGTSWETKVALTNKNICGLLERVRKEHHRIAGYINSGAGLKLQNLDSRITEAILIKMTDKGIPCLPVHDSYIVPRQFEKELREAMVDEYQAVLKFEPVIG